MRLAATGAHASSDAAFDCLFISLATEPGANGTHMTRSRMPRASLRARARKEGRWCIVNRERQGTGVRGSTQVNTRQTVMMGLSRFEAGSFALTLPALWPWTEPLLPTWTRCTRVAMGRCSGRRLTRC